MLRRFSAACIVWLIWIGNAGFSQEITEFHRFQTKDFIPVTINQLRSDPKAYAQKKVVVQGQVGEVSRSEQYVEVTEGAESLRVLIDALPSNQQERVYRAKPGGQLTAYGQFSGYVLFAERVDAGGK